MTHLIYYIIALVVVALDQATKLWIDQALELYQRIVVLPVFNITKAYNPGAAFSFLSDAGGWQRWLFTAISFAVSLMIIVWLTRLRQEERALGVALALILGGAVGNLIDRLAYGHVIDFIQVHWQERYFPSFNIADSAITCGAILLLVLSFFVDDASSMNKSGETRR